MWAVSPLPAAWASTAAGGGTLAKKCCQLTSPGLRSACGKGSTTQKLHSNDEHGVLLLQLL